MGANYCMACGARLSDRNIGGKMRRACPSCDFVHWGNYSIGVGAVVMREERVLLIRRAQEPGKGKWTVPGGYIEQDEAMEETVAREVMEETGIKAEVGEIIALRDLPRNVHNLYVVFRMKYLSGVPEPDGVEVDQAGFYTFKEMQSMETAGLTLWLAEAALPHKPGLIPDFTPQYPFNGTGFKI